YGVAKHFVQFDNYKAVFSDELFWRSLANAGIFIVVGFVIQMPLSFALALLVTSKIRGKNVFRTVYYIPVILGTTIVAVMWKNLVNPNYGAVMEIVRNLGIDFLDFDWLNTPWLNVWV